MVNYRDPAEIERDYLASMKLSYTMGGLFIWEFFTSLNYELSVIRGRRPYRWTIWVYSLTRVFTLAAAVENMTTFSITGSINCQAWITSTLLFGYIGVASGSMLIMLRTIAIWNRNKIVFALGMCAWLINVASLLRSLALIRSSWDPVQGACAVFDTDSGKFNVVATLSTDVFMLLMALCGLFRMRLDGGLSGLARFLWTQGIIRIAICVLALVPASVFVYLNLNGPFNVMFQFPALVINTISTTTMYRTLINFENSQYGTQSNAASRAMPVFAAPIDPSQTGVTDTSTERYPESEASRSNLHIDKDGKSFNKLH